MAESQPSIFARVRSMASRVAGLGSPATARLAAAAITTPSTPAPTTKKQAASGSYQQPSNRAYRTWTPSLLRSVAMTADGGSMSSLADLCDQLLADERIRKSYQTVVGGLLSLPLTFEAGEGRRRKAAIRALEAEEDWWAAFPESELQQFLTAGLCAGVSFAQLRWEWGKTRLIPHLEPWSLANFRWDWQKRAWFARVGDGVGTGFTEVEVTPGDGRWVVYMPFGGYRPWAQGQWRGLSPWWLLKRYAVSDSGRVGGVGASLVATPRDGALDDQTIKDQRRQLSQHLDELNKQGGVIVLPNGFDLSVVEISAKTAQIYDKQIAVANTSIDIAVQGQNLTSNVEGGSFAAASVHFQVQDRVIANVETTASTTLHDQALTWWADYNFGDRALAPWPAWDTDPPEDALAEAQASKAEAEAVKAWQDAGFDVENVVEIAAERGLKLVKREPQNPPAQPAQPQPPQNQNDASAEARAIRAALVAVHLDPVQYARAIRDVSPRLAAGILAAGADEAPATTEVRLPIGADGETISRLVICGGPRTGKSTLARGLRAAGVPTFCGDPRSKVKEPEDGVTYLPEDVPIAGDDGAAQWVCDNWLSMPGPWVLEGWVMGRALRRWLAANPYGKPFDAVVYLNQPMVDVSKGQAAMIKGCATVWAEVEPKLAERGVQAMSAPTVLGRFATMTPAESEAADNQ